MKFALERWVRMLLQLNNQYHDRTTPTLYMAT
jgi:hypothetical protein